MSIAESPEAGTLLSFDIDSETPRTIANLLEGTDLEVVDDRIVPLIFEERGWTTDEALLPRKSALEFRKGHDPMHVLERHSLARCTLYEWIWFAATRPDEAAELLAQNDIRLFGHQDKQFVIHMDDKGSVSLYNPKSPRSLIKNILIAGIRY